MAEVHREIRLPEPAPGVLFAGKYQVLERLGEGGTSVVFKARDLESGELVAVKIIRPENLENPRVLESFRREAGIASRLDHANVVRVIGSGEQDGLHYLVLEFVGGRPLSELLQLSPRLQLKEFLDLARQVAEALSVVHAAGIVHRDLKPANLIFARDGRLKLMDFGIARLTGETVTLGTARGTPEYMAPEQLVGEAATAYSDVFSAGAVFFEMLTGTQPLRGLSPAKRISNAPPRVRDAAASVPVAVASIVEACLAPDPHKRPSSNVLLEQLRSVNADGVGDDPLPAPPPPPPSEPERTLSHWLQEEPRPVAVVLPVMHRLLQILAKADEGGLVHDPITPGTVRLRGDAEPEIVTRPPLSESDTWMVAAPRYAAPELLGGGSAPDAAGRRSATIYSLGILFYELLAGGRRFRLQLRDVIDKGSDLAWLEWQVDREKRLAPLREVDETIPADISDLFSRMLEKDPAKRLANYRDAEFVIQNTIYRTQATQQFRVPVAAAPRPAARSPWHSHSALIIAGVAVATLLLLLLLRQLM
ncbi:MAG: protein kinase [Bryobacteraceae bacterium]|nr:protein kinase [Bryobacteraceae bacterium]